MVFPIMSVPNLRNRRFNDSFFFAKPCKKSNKKVPVDRISIADFPCYRDRGRGSHRCHCNRGMIRPCEFLQSCSASSTVKMGFSYRYINDSDINQNFSRTSMMVLAFRSIQYLYNERARWLVNDLSAVHYQPRVILVDDIEFF